MRNSPQGRHLHVVSTEGALSDEVKRRAQYEAGKTGREWAASVEAEHRAWHLTDRECAICGRRSQSHPSSGSHHKGRGRPVMAPGLGLTWPISCYDRRDREPTPGCWRP